MTEYSNLEGAFKGIVGDRSIKYKDGLVKLVAKYSPIVDDSESFCEITRDNNAIHRENQDFEETISPGFLQASIANLLVAEAMDYVDINTINFSYYFDESFMKMPIVTGADYGFEVVFDCYQTNKHFGVTVDLLNERNVLVYKLNKTLYRGTESDVFFPEMDETQKVHSSIFSSEYGFGISEKGRPVGAENIETNMFAISGASSVICDAIASEKLVLPPGVIALYDKQEVRGRFDADLNLKDGISLDLYISQRERFGLISKEAKEHLDPVVMEIVARDLDGRQLYHLTAPLSFQRDKLAGIVIRTEFKKRQKTKEEESDRYIKQHILKEESDTETKKKRSETDAEKEPSTTS